MTQVVALIEELETASLPSRKLDALITAWAYGPTGWVLDPVEDIDGWGILYAPDLSGQSATWICAADVLYVTRYMDAAMELITTACPHEAPAIATRALTKLLRQDCVGAEFAQRAACQMVAELLRALCVSSARDVISEIRSAA